MRHLTVLSAVASCLALSLFTFGCGGSSGNSIFGPPTGSGTVQFAISNSFSTSGGGAGQFTFPAGMTLAPNGNLVACDFGNGRAEIFTATGTYVSQIGSEGTGAGQLQSPSDVAISGGNYFVTDPATNAVVEYDSTSTFVKNLTAPVNFVKPTSITVDPSGNLYVGQSGAILIFNSSGTYTGEITSIGGTPLPSLIVAGLAADQNGDLYVLDPTSPATIDQITPGGAILTKIVTDGSPYSIATDGNNNVFFTDITNHIIQEYSNTGTLLSTCVTSINSQGLAVTTTDTLFTAVGTSPGGFIAVYHKTN
jgi:tripartite motif-containing protein 71